MLTMKLTQLILVCLLWLFEVHVYGDGTGQGNTTSNFDDTGSSVTTMSMAVIQHDDGDNGKEQGNATSNFDGSATTLATVEERNELYFIQRKLEDFDLVYITSDAILLEAVVPKNDSLYGVCNSEAFLYNLDSYSLCYNYFEKGEVYRGKEQGTTLSYGSVHWESLVIDFNCTTGMAITNTDCVQTSLYLETCTTDDFENQSACSKCLGVICSPRSLRMVTPFLCFGGSRNVFAASSGYLVLIALFTAIVCFVTCTACRKGCCRGRKRPVPRNRPARDQPPSYDSVFYNQETQVVLYSEESEPPPPAYDVVVSAISQSVPFDSVTSEATNDNNEQGDIPPPDYEA